MDYLTPVLTFFAFLFGGACTWGMMRATVSRLVTDVAKLSEQVARTAEVIAHLDSVVQDVGRLRNQMDKTVELFSKFEMECRTRFAAEDERRRVLNTRKRKNGTI